MRHSQHNRFQCLNAFQRHFRLAMSALFCLTILTLGQAHAAWFQASGQAVIVNDDKQLARQQATQEAIKQALLFAGASVTSVQHLTNGLLQNDQLEIRATGEVNQIELIDEQYNADYVTVSIRADIFPQQQQCAGSSYKKSLVTAYMPFQNRAQTQDGHIFPLSRSAVMRLPAIAQHVADNTMIAHIVAEQYNWDASSIKQQAHQLAVKTDAQFVLAITAQDVSVHRPQGSLAFWQDNSPKRAFVIRAQVYDAMSGAAVYDNIFGTQASWEFDKFSRVDVYSDQFWSSAYGQAVIETLENMIVNVDNALSCHQTSGRVLAVANNQLQINLGEQHNVKPGDALTLFKTQEVFDAFGQTYLQHNIHPNQVRVTQVYPTTATVTSVDGSFLANIQPNDYVAKQ